MGPRTKTILGAESQVGHPDSTGIDFGPDMAVGGSPASGPLFAEKGVDARSADRDRFFKSPWGSHRIAKASIPTSSGQGAD